MAKKDMMWGFLVHLTYNFWEERSDTRNFEDSAWEYILDGAEKAGINTIVLDLGDGLCYGSHPEIALRDAWTRKRLRDEISRCKERGIRMIPKLNFSSTHDIWLGEYERMLSSNTYYKVCSDLIREVYELFEHPEYIHLGMDEEHRDTYKKFDFVAYRQGKLYWHDMRFLLDCVHETGAKPWIWSCSLFKDPEEFMKHVDPKEVIISPFQYNALYPEHYTAIASEEKYRRHYSQEKYKGMNLTYVEEDPFHTRFRELSLPLLEKGFSYIPCISVNNHCDWNTPDMLRYFKENAPEEQILGYLAAPWYPTTEEHNCDVDETFRLLAPAKEQYYGK